MPAPGALGGEERLEQAPRTSSLMPVPGVADREQHVRAGRDVAVGGDVVLVEVDVAGLDRQPRRRCGIASRALAARLSDHPLDLRAVGLDRREPVASWTRDADVVADDALEHRLHAARRSR